MPEEPWGLGLREKITAIICEERPTPDNVLESTTIRERLESELGIGVSEDALHGVLTQLANDDKIKLVLALSLPPREGTIPSAMSIHRVRPELCE